MKRPERSPVDGTYTVKGKKYKELFGSREQVWNGTAYKTEGGLTRDRLHMNDKHRIVSAVKFKTAKKEMRLQKYGYHAKKGKFGYVKKTAKKFDKKLLLSKKYGNKKAVLHSGGEGGDETISNDEDEDDEDK
jgi:hypothetical protein